MVEVPGIPGPSHPNDVPPSHVPVTNGGSSEPSGAASATEDLVGRDSLPAKPPTATVSPPKAEEIKVSTAATSAPVTPETGFSYAVVLGWNL